MSRIGRKKISVLPGVKIELLNHLVKIHGPKGELSVVLPPGVTVSAADDAVSVEVKDSLRQTRAYHGLVRSLINNAVTGVTTGFKKTLKLQGTGYRVQAKGTGISLAVGFSHSVDYAPPAGVSLKVEGNNVIHIDGIDKQAVGQVAAEIRAIRPPEVYKGKGIRYEDEVVKLKPGKTTA